MFVLESSGLLDDIIAFPTAPRGRVSGDFRDMGDSVRAAAASARVLAGALRRRAPGAQTTTTAVSAQTTTSWTPAGFFSFSGRFLGGVPWPGVASIAGGCGVGARRVDDWPGKTSRLHSPSSSGIGGFAARGVGSSTRVGSTPGGGGPPSSFEDESHVGKEDEGEPSLSGQGEESGDAVTSKSNSRKDLYMMFTCGRCDTRAAKGFSRQAYENGVVIVRCPGCQSQHLVADRYGWFGEPGSVEDFLADQTVVRGAASLGAEDEDGTLEIDEAQLNAWVAKGLRGKEETDEASDGS